jgi:hypothetical protein
MIWKIWKKDKLNSEKIWKIYKKIAIRKLWKDMKNMEENCEKI